MDRQAERAPAQSTQAPQARALGGSAPAKPPALPVVARSALCKSALLLRILMDPDSQRERFNPGFVRRNVVWV